MTSQELKTLENKKENFLSALKFHVEGKQRFSWFLINYKIFFQFCLFVYSIKQSKIQNEENIIPGSFLLSLSGQIFNTEGHGDRSFKPTPCLDAHLKYYKKGKIKAYYKKRIVSTGDLSSSRTSEAARLSPEIPEPALPDAFGPSRWWQWGRAPRCMVPPACHPPKDEPWVHSRCGGGIRDA